MIARLLDTRERRRVAAHAWAYRTSYPFFLRVLRRVMRGGS